MVVLTGSPNSSRYNDHLLRISVHWKWIFNWALPLRNLVLPPRVLRGSFIRLDGKSRGFTSISTFRFTDLFENRIFLLSFLIFSFLYFQLAFYNSSLNQTTSVNFGVDGSKV